MALTKAEMAERLFENVGLNKREAKEFVDAFFEVVREALPVTAPLAALSWPDVPVPWPLWGVVVSTAYAWHLALICLFVLLALNLRHTLLRRAILGYLPGFATPRIVCDVPFVGKRWVHQVERYDRELGVSYWSKNYRTVLDGSDSDALDRVHPFYDPIDSLPASGQAWWRKNAGTKCGTRHPADNQRVELPA